jgi:hypothetical protein
MQASRQAQAETTMEQTGRHTYTDKTRHTACLPPCPPSPNGQKPTQKRPNAHIPGERKEMPSATAYPPCGVGRMMSPGQPTAASSTSCCIGSVFKRVAFVRSKTPLYSCDSGSGLEGRGLCRCLCRGRCFCCCCLLAWVDRVCVVHSRGCVLGVWSVRRGGRPTPPRSPVVVCVCVCVCFCWGGERSAPRAAMVACCARGCMPAGHQSACVCVCVCALHPSSSLVCEGVRVFARSATEEGEVAHGSNPDRDRSMPPNKQQQEDYHTASIPIDRHVCVCVHTSGGVLKRHHHPLVDLKKIDSDTSDLARLFRAKNRAIPPLGP